MIPVRHAIDAHAQDFVAKDELLLPIPKAFAQCTRYSETFDIFSQCVVVNCLSLQPIAVIKSPLQSTPPAWHQTRPTPHGDHPLVCIYNILLFAKSVWETAPRTSCQDQRSSGRNLNLGLPNTKQGCCPVHLDIPSCTAGSLELHMRANTEGYQRNEQLCCSSSFLQNLWYTSSVNTRHRNEGQGWKRNLVVGYIRVVLAFFSPELTD
jgi:hypothetical protein